jgi:TolB protein
LEHGTRRGPVANQVDTSIRSFLAWSRYFPVLPEGQNPDGASFENIRVTTIDFQAWFEAGAYAVIKGSFNAHPEGGYRLQLRLYITEEASHFPLAHDDQTLESSEPAHIKDAVSRWLNDLIEAFTGRRGSYGTRIAFAHRENRRASKEIMVMDLDGYVRRRVTQNGAINLLPAWTPDGRVAYTSFLEHNPDLYIEGQKFSGRERMNTGVSFHRDGRAALTLSKDGNPEIYLLQTETGDIIARLTDHPSIDTSPSWASDGEQLAFVSDRDTGLPQIYTLTISDRSVRRLPQVGGYNSSPDWSPVRDDIIYSAMSSRERYDLYRIRLSDGSVHRLTSTGSNEEPCFSRDGRYIAFARTMDGKQGIWIMTSHGEHPRRVSNGPGIFTTPAWEH